MATLYDLTHTFKQVQTMIEEGHEGLEDTLESIDMAIEDKMENIGKVIRNIESEINQFKEEEKRLSDRRRSLENQIKNLKSYAESSMLDIGQKKIKTGIFTFSIQKNPPSVNIIDERLVPKEYFTPADPVMDKKTIREDLKNGKEIPGVEMVQRESLRMR